jgi:hypothetical protein
MYLQKFIFCFEFQIPATITRILLNHFKWDKEKLMERYYDSDQEQLFSEARVVSPFRKTSVPKVKVLNLNFLLVWHQ